MATSAFSWQVIQCCLELTIAVILKPFICDFNLWFGNEEKQKRIQNPVKHLKWSILLWPLLWVLNALLKNVFSQDIAKCRHRNETESQTFETFKLYIGV